MGAMISDWQLPAIHVSLGFRKTTIEKGTRDGTQEKWITALC
jgi:hypothetical protein